jgi:hypothetical protein
LHHFHSRAVSDWLAPRTSARVRRNPFRALTIAQRQQVLDAVHQPRFIDRSGFRRFEDSLIDDARWRDKDAVLHEIGAPLLLAPIEETLVALREEIEAGFVSVNKRIEDGSNEHIKITGVGIKRRWTLIYPTCQRRVKTDPVSPG